MASGATPQTIKLPRKNEYQIEFKVPGYNSQSVPLTKGLNGWVWGNLLIGWIRVSSSTSQAVRPHKLVPRSPGYAHVSRGDDAQAFGIVKQLDAQGVL